MSKSFSAVDYKSVEVKGTVIADICHSTMVLVEESLPSLPPCLWIIDKLDDVGISLEREDVQEILPLLQEWCNGTSK